MPTRGTASGTIPSGLIAMWHGTIANIPSGWVICDGNNGTPNLLDKFVKGVPTAATNPGTTGGAVNKTTAGHGHTAPSCSNPDTTIGAAYGGILAASSTHIHTIDAIASNTDSIADIRPPYYELAFIMKT
jgi:hypothetical protein